MPSLADRVDDDHAPLRVRFAQPLTEVPVLLGAALADLAALADVAAERVTERPTGPGFLSVEARQALSEQHRKEQHARYLNATLGIDPPGFTPAPANVAAVSIVEEIDRFLRSLVDDLHRRVRRAGVCLMAEGFYLSATSGGRVTRQELAGYGAVLVAGYTRPAALRAWHTDAEQLAAKARRFINGAQTMAHPDPCPWCGLRTLVVHATDGIIRCEADPATGRRQPCICADTYCPCHSDGRFRHEWHRSPVDLRLATVRVADVPDVALQDAVDELTDRSPHRRRSETWHGLLDAQADRATRKDHP